MKSSLAASLAALLLLSGCIRTVYLEQETPAGNVPRSVAPPAPGVEQGLQAAYQANAVTADQNSEAAADRFRAAYAKANEPRFAVYLNRSLSDEVREWKANARVVLAERVRAQEAYERTAVRNGAARTAVLAVAGAQGEQGETRKSIAGQVAAEGEFSIAEQTLQEDQPRPAMDEVWGWELEDGFSKPLLDAGVRLIDRATILRLTAAEQGKQGTAGQLALRQVEMEALKGYTDLLVEILIADRAETGRNYEFKVSVKEVQSGRILASATTLYPDSRKMAQRYKETSHGFEAQGEDPYLTGRDLAHQVMSSLTKAWER